MNGCGVQWNAHLPGFEKVRRQLLPGWMRPESKLPSSATMLCATGSLFVQTTVVPAVTSSFAGMKATLCIVVLRVPDAMPIDIQPGSAANRINLKKPGNISVAVLSSADFHTPDRVDRTSLTFGRTGDEASLVSCSKHPRDVNGDGRADVIAVNAIDGGGQCWL